MGIALQTIVDNVSALVYVKDRDGRYVLVNRRFEEVHSSGRDELLGKTDWDLLPSAAPRYRENDLRVLATGQPIEVEEPGLREEERYLSSKFPLLDRAGRPAAVGGVSKDVTGLSRMSHELRTPLHSILGYGQLLQLDGLHPGAAQSLDRMLGAARHLLALIDEVLDIARTEAGGHAVSIEPVHACDPFHDALELVRPIARERDVELVRDLHAGLYRFVLADRRRLEQVLLNVLSNAIKYNRPGGTVTARFRAGEERLRFLVADTGPGIDPRRVDRIFAPFERLDADRSGVEGTGLGLALSKSLVEAMGGTIGVESTAPGRGTVFFVELPLTEQPAEALVLDTPPVDGLTPARILYVEDNLASLDLAQRLLERVGEIEVIPAMQGSLALDLAAQHAPDLILLDLHLPDVDGGEVLRRLKRNARTRRIPVVVLSADATPTRIAGLRAQGAEAYLTKPLDLREFLDAIRRALVP